MQRKILFDIDLISEARKKSANPNVAQFAAAHRMNAVIIPTVMLEGFDGIAASMNPIGTLSLQAYYTELLAESAGFSACTLHDLAALAALRALPEIKAIGANRTILEKVAFSISRDIPIATAGTTIYRQFAKCSIALPGVIDVRTMTWSVQCRSPSYMAWLESAFQALDESHLYEHT